MKKNIIIIVLAVIVLSIGGYLVYDKFINKNEETTTSTKNSENDKLDEIQTDERVKKIDYSKEYVYDAEYEHNATSESYSTSENTYNVSDIVVPFININSTDANSANTMIKGMYNICISKFNEGINDNITYVDKCNYESYINNDILSIVITYGFGGTDIVNYGYMTYNFDLTTGLKVSYEDLYKNAGLTSENINTKVNNAIDKYLENELSTLSPDNYEAGEDINTYKKYSYNYYNDLVNNKTLGYYLDSNLRLNIVTNVGMPIGREIFSVILKI